MRYVAYDRLGSEPNIVVDGYGTASTVLTLSHWPGSATPDELKRDLSTQIAFAYLDRPDLRVDATAVSNNHFDEDGLCGMYALCNPDAARRAREQLIDVASAGDFGTYRDRDSARIAFALMAYADAERSPLGAKLTAQPYQRQTETLYTHLLEALPDMLAHPQRYEDLWAEEDALHQRTIDEIARGTIAVEERPDIDLAVVTASGAATWPHQSALNNATRRMRVLTIQRNRYELRDRYETWVEYTSEPLASRIDMAPLAERLADEDGTTWSAGDVDELTPTLAPDGESRLDASHVRALVEEHLVRERAQ